MTTSGKKVPRRGRPRSVPRRKERPAPGASIEDLAMEVGPFITVTDADDGRTRTISVDVIGQVREIRASRNPLTLIYHKVDPTVRWRVIEGLRKVLTMIGKAKGIGNGEGRNETPTPDP